MTADKLHRMAPHLLVFHCPACKYGHHIQINTEFTNQGPYWGWNGSLDAPTITPSILVRGNEFGGWSPRCHSFVTDGKIQFLNDCTHALAGQTVEIPSWHDDEDFPASV